MRQSIPTAALHLSNDCLYEEKGKEGPVSWLALLTRWLFEQAGITTGMRVLDVGSSAGAVALLLAEMVGPTGSVVSVELHPALLEPARKQGRAAGLTNVSWCASMSRALAGQQTFDAVVGRNCLLYVSDPIVFVSQYVEHLRPGGIAVFQEVDRSVSEQLAHLLVSPVLGEHGLFWMAGKQEAAQFEEHTLRPHYFMAGVTARKLA
jgi:2-polyprenyl-3-methyl-5-hydroxy-6-metoxy-1,4-benzoquinol methylase